LTLSAYGFDDEAETIVNKLQEKHPEHTIINSVLAPIVRAGIALARERPAEAIEHLQMVEPYELGFAAVLAPIYLRAQSYLMLGSGSEAAQQFQRLLDHRGSEPFSPFYPVAPLGVARAEASIGNIKASLKSYERFITNWTDADQDIPVLIEARKEYRDLNSKLNSRRKAHTVHSSKR